MHPDIFSLAELLTYGVKGLSCYFKHAQLLYDTNVPGDWYNDQLNTIERFIARVGFPIRAVCPLSDTNPSD